MFKILLLSLFLLTSSFSKTNTGDKKVKLLGEKKVNVNKRIKIKDIEKIAYVDFTIRDPYLKKDTKYGGVLLKDFISFYAKSSVTSVIFTAIDDYQIIFKKEEWEKETILLSTKFNDEYTSFKQRGPLRIIYPNYDPSLKKYSKNLVKWIWMIKSIEFK